MVYVREAENDHHHQNPSIFGHFFVAGAMFLRYNCFVVGFLIQSSARLDARGGPVVPRVRYWWPRVRDVDVVQAIATSFEFLRNLTEFCTDHNIIAAYLSEITYAVQARILSS